MQENITAPVLELDYSLDSKTAESSILEYHSAKSKVKTTAQIAVLGAFALLFAVDAIIRFDTMKLFMIAACLICIAFIVFTPKTQARDMSAKFGSGKAFRLSLFSDRVCISNGDSVSELALSRSRISETQSFLYFEAEKRMFSVPKSFMSEEQRADFDKFLQENPQINYKNYNKK